MAIRNIIQKAEQEYPPIVGGITGIDLSNYVQSGDIYNAAVEWTQNHTLVDGTRYLIGDLVYVSGRIYKANYDNESIPVTDSLYWTDLGPGYRLNIDGRDIPNISNVNNSQYVQLTGNQTISGIKDFTVRPTVNGTGVLLEGEAYPPNNPSGFITGIDFSPYATVTNLEITGSTLDTKIDNLSGYSVLVSGEQFINGVKIFLDKNIFRSGIQIGERSETENPNPIIEFFDGSNDDYNELTWSESILSFKNYPDNGGQSLIYNFNQDENPDTKTIAVDERVIHNFGNEKVSGQKTFIDHTDFQQDISVSGFYNFDITNTGQPLDGQMNWNPDYGTAQIGMGTGNVINPVGFKSFYRVKAASNIRKGKVVMAIGGVGNSEYILAREAQNIGNSGQLIMGISAEEILTNNFGDIVSFGAVRGVDTSTIPVDSILYYDPLSTGGLTHVPPQSPFPKVIVALNTTSSNNGIVFVRVTANSELGITDSNVKFNNIQDKDVVKYSSDSGLWLNSQLNTGDISGISNFVTINSDQIISGNKIFEAEEYIFSGANCVMTGNSILSIDTETQTKGVVKDLGSASGIQVMTTGAYNAITPLSGVIYILI